VLPIVPRAQPAGTAMVDGQRVLVLRRPDHAVLDVAAAGKPCPMRFSGGNATEGTFISTCSQGNSVPPVNPPPPADIVGPAAGQPRARVRPPGPGGCRPPGGLCFRMF
jgi:hypothetical protein